jgi:hypothetical protein
VHNDNTKFVEFDKLFDSIMISSDLLKCHVSLRFLLHGHFICHGVSLLLSRRLLRVSMSLRTFHMVSEPHVSCNDGSFPLIVIHMFDH